MKKTDTAMLTALAAGRNATGQTVSAAGYLARTTKPHRTLAVDPSITEMGFALFNGKALVSSGTWKPSGAKDKPDRFDQLADFIAKTVRTYAVDTVVVEIPSAHHTSVNRKAADINKITYGRAVEGVGAAARVAGAEVCRVEVNAWKGTAKKSHTAEMVRLRFGIRHEATDNETDAVGLGDWWLASQRVAAGAGVAR